MSTYGASGHAPTTVCLRANAGDGWIGGTQSGHPLYRWPAMRGFAKQRRNTWPGSLVYMKE